jgi:hypothetical protein
VVLRRVDALLWEWRHGWSRRRWLVPVAAAFNLIAIVFADATAAGVLLAFSAVFVLLAAWQTERSHRRLRRYRVLARDEASSS